MLRGYRRAMPPRSRTLKSGAASASWSNASRQTTRTATSGRASALRARHLLRPGQVIESPETSFKYAVDRLLGEGGFGQVYLAQRLGRSRDVPEILCIKVSTRIDGWLREAYFGQLLDEHPAGHSRFRRVPAARGPTAQVLYCLALEYARHGDLSAFLHRHGDGWPERTARREIAGILEVLGKLHRGQLLHRDLTPLNVFVCDGRQLKLGDFGIVRQQSDRRGITARTMNALTAPSDILAGTAPKWQARDDVYQVGQLLGMLVKGDARARIRTPDVRSLPCSDHLKEIVYRCIGERRKRYESADELIDALRNPPAHAQRRRAADAQGRAPRVHRHPQQAAPRRHRVPRAAPARSSTADPRRKTTVVVRGRPNALQAAGRDAGLKLMEIKRLREKGHKITLLNDSAVLAAGHQAVRTRCGYSSSRTTGRLPISWPRG